jgi:branched-chain amino acid transport system substrate-binding protein
MKKQEGSASRNTLAAAKPGNNDQGSEEGLQNTPLLLQSENPSDIARWLVSLIVTKEWPGLLFAASGILWLVLRPDGGLIVKDVLPVPHPILYGRLFWLIECSLLIIGFCLLLLREYRNFQISQGKGGSVSQKRRVRFLSFFLPAVLFLIGGLYVRQNLRAAVPPSFYLKCDASGDCFSWGENILMSYGYVEDANSLESNTFSKGNEELEDYSQRDTTKNQCKQLWRLKASSVALYNTGEAVATLEDFREKCKNDAESLIYLNNLKALQKGKTYDIAVSLPISTEGGESESQEVLRGVAIAQHKINELGIGNRRMLVGIADDGFRITPPEINLQSNKEKKSAKDIATELVSNARLLGIVGHFSSDATEAAAGVYANNPEDKSTNIVAVSPTSTAIRSSQDFTALGIDIGKGIKLPETIFRTALNDGTVIGALVEQISDEYEKVGVVYEGNSTYSSLFKESFLTAFEKDGGDVMSDEAEKNCDFDRKNSYNEIGCLQAAKDEGVSALLLVPSTKSSRSIRDLIIKNSEEFNFPLLGADSMYDSSFLNEKTEGMLLYVTWHRSDSSDSPSDFEKEALDLFGTTVINWRTATAYDATMALNRGIEMASETYCKGERLLQNSRFLLNDKKYIDCIRSHLSETMHDDQFTADGSSEKNSIKFEDSGDLDNGRLGVFVRVQRKGNGYDFVGLPQLSS